MTFASSPPDLLAAIVAATRRSVEARAIEIPLAVLEGHAHAVEPRHGAFRRALVRERRINVIAECKRRSPSRGVLRMQYDAAAIATGYDAAGAAAISVLTEPTFFDGALEHLAAVRTATRLPILRKDFVVDRYQILEARAAGADAVLLIVSALTPESLARLHADATEAGLDVLVEIHDLRELAPALDAGASIVGVNNRNLKTLTVDTDVSLKAIERIPDNVVAVAESGLRTGQDLGIFDGPVMTFLIGERLMCADDPGKALSDLLKDGEA